MMERVSTGEKVLLLLVICVKFSRKAKTSHFEKHHMPAWWGAYWVFDNLVNSFGKHIVGHPRDEASPSFLSSVCRVAQNVLKASHASPVCYWCILGIAYNTAGDWGTQHRTLHSHEDEHRANCAFASRIVVPLLPSGRSKKSRPFTSSSACEHILYFSKASLQLLESHIYTCGCHDVKRGGKESTPTHSDPVWPGYQSSLSGSWLSFSMVRRYRLDSIFVLGFETKFGMFCSNTDRTLCRNGEMNLKNCCLSHLMLFPTWLDFLERAKIRAGICHLSETTDLYGIFSRTDFKDIVETNFEVDKIFVRSLRHLSQSLFRQCLSCIGRNAGTFSSQRKTNVLRGIFGILWYLATGLDLNQGESTPSYRHSVVLVSFKFSMTKALPICLGIDCFPNYEETFYFHVVRRGFT